MWTEGKSLALGWGNWHFSRAAKHASISFLFCCLTDRTSSLPRRSHFCYSAPSGAHQKAGHIHLKTVILASRNLPALGGTRASVTQGHCHSRPTEQPSLNQPLDFSALWEGGGVKHLAKVTTSLGKDLQQGYKCHNAKSYRSRWRCRTHSNRPSREKPVHSDSWLGQGCAGEENSYYHFTELATSSIRQDF